jgi:hypothetical protein
VLSSSGNSSAPERLWDGFKEDGKTTAINIDLFDDDDEIDSRAIPPARVQGLKNSGTLPAKRPRIEIDLT